MQGLNNENQTGATDNLLNDLKKEPFASAVTKLHLEAEVAGIQTTNDTFRTFMVGRRATARDAAMEETHVNKMRRELTDKYTGLCIYVMAMTDAYPDVPEWAKSLAAINVIRKRYAEILTRRAAAQKDKDPNAPKQPKTPKEPKDPKDPKTPEQHKEPKQPDTPQPPQPPKPGGDGDPDIHLPEE